MARILRSLSRRKRLQLQHIQQLNRILRGKVSNRTETNIDCLNQGEFLSLFGLTANPIQSKSIKKRKHLERKPIKKPRKKRIRKHNDDVSQNASKILENHIATEQHVQRILLANNESILNAMRDVIADKRKCDTLYEHDKQMNIILKFTTNELHKKIIFICKSNFITSGEPHHLPNNNR